MEVVLVDLPHFVAKRISAMWAELFGSMDLNSLKISPKMTVISLRVRFNPPIDHRKSVIFSTELNC